MKRSNSHKQKTNLYSSISIQTGAVLAGRCLKKYSRKKQVGDFFNAQFVCINWTQKKEGKALAQQFNIKAYPTFIIADQQGNAKVTITGAFPADAFITKVKNELNPELTPERMKQRYESGERTPELVNAYAMDFMEKRNTMKGIKSLMTISIHWQINRNFRQKICLFSHDTLLTSPTRNVNIG